ncbi:SAM-dependent methyltransferase [Streptomyces sp. NPDC001435]|uniref:SAM-dependent methyltransferase n=1 Tax=unclassified Streptomyces TaxID=2593676 RepID=UPI00367C17B9
MTDHLPYATGTVRENVERALTAAAHDPEQLTPQTLAPLEDFHVLGRLATTALLDLAAVTADDRVLDAGCGIGGTARYLAGQLGCRVTAVDLTAEYCDTARWLNDAVGLGDRIEVRQADVLDLPFDAGGFDVVVSQHVQMNIADKARLYAEAARVLAPGGRLVLWDVTEGPQTPLRFPVPWADSADGSHLVTPQALHELVEHAGFEVRAWNDLTRDSAELLRALLNQPPGPLGLQAYVPDFAKKARVLLENLKEDRTRLVQAVLVKP